MKLRTGTGRAGPRSSTPATSKAWIIGALTVLLVSLAGVAWGQEQQTAPTLATDLTQVSLENLMNMEVTTVSKKEQKLSRTAAAVFVITQEDIRRSGAQNLPDLLRMVPGMDVAQINGDTWAISARGLNAQFSNELLVLLDGRNVYSPTSGGVFWDTLDGSVTNIERIEVVRGPGATVWGENAVNGVVNIITKKASETAGGLVEAGTGNVRRESGLAQYGGDLGKNTQYRIFTKYFNNDGMESLDGGNGGDGWHMLRGGFRTDTAITKSNTLAVKGDMYVGREGIPTAVLPSIVAPKAEPHELLANVSGGYVQAWWDQAGERSKGTLMVSYDQYERSDWLGDHRETFTLDYHRHREWGKRQQILWGTVYHRTSSKTEGSLEMALVPPGLLVHVFSGFVQDQIALVPDRMYITVGTKLEHNTYSGFGIMPTARMACQLNQKQMIWVAISRGLRTPADTDVALRQNVGGFTQTDGTPVAISIFGNPHVKDEGLTAYEAGYRVEINRRLSFDLAAYYNEYDRQESSEPGIPFFEDNPAPPHLVLPSITENLLDGEAHGLEISGSWKVTARWTLTPSYDFERIHMRPRPGSQDFGSGPEIEGSDPHEHARLRSHVELPHKIGWESDVYFTGRLASGPVPAYTRIDTGATWQWKGGVSASVFGENLAKANHLEFFNADGVATPTLVRRGWHAKVAWQF